MERFQQSKFKGSENPPVN